MSECPPPGVAAGAAGRGAQALTPDAVAAVLADFQTWLRDLAASPPAAEPAPSPAIDLHTLLVEPRWSRRGHGSRLLAAAVDHLRADGVARAVVWLVEGDVAATTFYESAGWQRDGTVRTLVDDGQTVREARFHVSLEGEA